MNHNQSIRDVEPSSAYVPQAIYFLDSDCVEYVKEDSLCVYERVDDFLTLIFDESRIIPIGFKLKGFKFVFEQELKPLFKLRDMQFIDLVEAIELYFTRVGEKIFADQDDQRVRAYKAALKIAANDNVRLAGSALGKIAA